MTPIAHTLLALTLSTAGLAQAPETDDTMSQLSRSAEQDLRRSNEELSELRDEIAAESLPMSQELSALEERVTELRREHERVARSEDAGNLETARLVTERKILEDELTYVGVRLDEYARTFESRINPCELQRCGAAIESAKQAGEDGSLSMNDKLTRQLGFVQESLVRLFDAIGGMRFPGVAVDLEGTVAQGTYAIVGPVALFAAQAGAAGLAVPQSGSTNPLIRPLEGTAQAGLADLVRNGEGLLPLDPSRGGALKALLQETSLIHIFEKGGPIMWPLLLASILALGTVLERMLMLMRERARRDPKAVEALFAEVGRGRIDHAIRASKESKDYVVRALVYALEHKGQSLPNALVYAEERELKRFRGGIPILDTVITLAPLLGLLGTVTGMMGSFSLIGGELSAPGAITGGIAEALIATAFGLGIAITCLLPFNFLNSKLEKVGHEIDAAATQLKMLLEPHGGAPHHKPHGWEPIAELIAAAQE